ncbi:MAG: HAD family hydrolase [Bacillota bacterium]|jgi:pyrophosphatase PpaX
MTAILFDLDGTIANSLPGILDTTRRTYENFNLPWHKEEALSLVGLPLLAVGEKLLGANHAQEYYDAYQKNFLSYRGADVEAYDGIPQLLQKLTAQEIPLAIVTSKVRRGCLRTLKALDLTHYFKHLVTASDGCGAKPDPEPVLCACQKLGKEPSETLFIGDSFFDIKSGQAAGTTTCAVSWGAGKRADLLAYGPDFMAENVPELDEIVFKWLRPFNK